MQVSLAKSQYVEFNIPEPVPEVIVLPEFEGMIRPGSIPPQVKIIDAHACTITKLEPGAIPNSVTHLYLRNLTKDMVIPASVTHLVVFIFREDMIRFVPLTVTHLYIHTANHQDAPADRDHYYYNGGALGIPQYLRRRGYILGELFQDESFGHALSVIKRTCEQPATELEQPTEMVIRVGKVYTELDISESGECIIPPAFTGRLRPGSIPERFVCVNLKNCEIDELEPGVITDSVTHLFLRELNEHMTIPASVKHLAIFNFRRNMLQYVPSTVTNLYIHLADRYDMPTDRPHYVFRMQGFERKQFRLQRDIYDVTGPFSDSRFGYKTTFAKREPKPTLDKAMIEITSLKAEVASLKATVQNLTQVM